MKKYFSGILAFTFFFLAVLFFFHRAWLDNFVIQGIDGNYTLRLLRAQSMQAGTGAWWNPYRWLGSGALFPLRTHFLFSAWLPMRWEMTAYVGTMILAGGLFSWLFLRRRGVTPLAAVFGAVAWGFSPHFITLVYPSHISVIAILAYAPMLFYFIDRALDDDSSGWRVWIYALPAGFAWGMMMNEDVQRGLYFSVAAGAYGLFLLLRKASWKPFRIDWRRVIRLSLIGAVMLTVFAHNASLQFGSKLVRGKVSGVQQDSPKAEEEKWAFATSWSLHPKELLDSLAPGYHGMISGDPDRPYWGERPVAHSNDGMGFFVVAFGLAGAILAFRTSGTARFFTIAAVLATLLAFGQYWPGRPLFWLWYKLPMMAKMRAPVKFMAVAVFSLSVLSAYGFDSLLRAFKERQRKTLIRWTTAFGTVGLIGGIGILGVLSGDSALQGHALDGAVQALIWMVLFAAGAAVLTGLQVREKAPSFLPKTAAVLFIFMSLGSLWQINQFYLGRSWFKPSEFYRPDGVVQFLQEQAPGRVAASLKISHQGRMVPLPMAANRSMYITHIFPYFGIPSMEHTPQSRIAGDYDTFFNAVLPGVPAVRSPQQIINTLLDGQLRFWRLSGVRYVVTDGYLYGISQRPMPIMDALKKRPELKLVYSGAGLGRPHAVFELKEALPMFSLFSATERLAEREDVPGRLSSSTFDPLQAVVLSSEDAPQVGKAYDGFLPVDVVDQSPDRIELSVDAPADSVLLWNSRFDKGWKVEVDGEPVETFPANYILTGVPVPAGSHTVVLSYRPAMGLLSLSLAMAGIGLLSVFIIGLIPRPNDSTCNGEKQGV